MKLNKQILTVLAVLVVLGLLTALLFFLFPAAPRQAQPAEVVLSDRAQNAFASADITNASGHCTVSYKNGVFSCDALDGLPLSQAACELLAAQCTSLTATGPVPQPSGSGADDFGFTHPTAAVQVVFSDAGGIGIEIGARVAGTGQYYIRVDKSTSVYLVDGSAVSQLLTGVSGYLDLSLTPSGTDANTTPSRIDLLRGGTELHLQKLTSPETDAQGVTYRFVLDDTRRDYVDPDSYETYFGDLGTLAADGVVTMNPTDVDLEVYGLAEKDAPEILRYTMLGETITLRIGSKGSGFYYLYREGVPAIYRLPELSVTWDDATRYALMSRYLLAPDAADVREIDIETDGIVRRLVFEDTGSVTLDGTPLTAAVADSFYKLITSLRAEYELTDPVDNIAPAMTLTFIYRDRVRGAAAASPAPSAAPSAAAAGYRTDVVRFIPYGAKRCAIEINGSAAYVVRSAYVTRVLEAMDGLGSGQPVSAAW